MEPDRPNPRDIAFYYSLAQVGLEMVVPIGLGVLLDVYLGTMPWGVIVGAVLGPVVGVTHLVGMLNQRNRAKAADKERDTQ